jgi:hypothetical protein
VIRCGRSAAHRGDQRLMIAPLSQTKARPNSGWMRLLAQIPTTHTHPTHTSLHSIISVSFSWNVKDQLLDAHQSTTSLLRRASQPWQKTYLCCFESFSLLSIRRCQKHKNWLYYKIKDSKTNVKHLAYAKGYFRNLVKISILTAKLCMQAPKMIWFDTDMFQCLVDSVLIAGQQERSSGLTGCRCDCSGLLTQVLQCW